MDMASRTESTSGAQWPVLPCGHAGCSGQAKPCLRTLVPPSQGSFLDLWEDLTQEGHRESSSKRSALTPGLCDPPPGRPLANAEGSDWPLPQRAWPEAVALKGEPKGIGKISCIIFSSNLYLRVGKNASSLQELL